MTSFYRAITAVCLVTFSGLQSAAGSDKTYKWTAEDVDADAYLSVNLARNGNLSVHINEVATDAGLVNSLKTTVTGSTDMRAQNNCQELIESKDKLKDVFYSVIKSEDEVDYRQLLQASLDAGLNLFTTKEYPKTAGEWKTIWANKAGANLAYLLSSNSTTVGCVIGKCIGEPASSTGPQGPGGREAETTVEMAVLLCDIDPPAAKDQAPFDEEYFAGLIKRTAKLADMTADDLKATTNDGTATAAIPTILTACLIAMLAVASA